MASDDPRQVAFNPAAPADERFDAQAELQKAHAPSTSRGLIPSDEIQSIINYIDDGLEQGAMLKARNNVLTFPEARGSWGGGPQKPSKRGVQSVYVDDLQVISSGDYFEKPATMNFDALRVMCDQTPLLASVIMTRIRQVSRFCGISEDGGPGFEIRHRERSHLLTPEEKAVTELLGRFIADCGWERTARGRKKLKRDNFQQFMAKSIRDSLSMDSCPIETEWKTDKSLGLDGFYAIDGSTIRLCHEQGYKGDDELFALQVVDGRVVTAYTHDQLVYEVRNPRTDVKLGGYGMAEPEQLVRVVTGFLNAMTYNNRGFDNNSIPRGLLHMSGDYSQEDMIAFKRYWNSMVKGINNTWALPVMISKDQESKASFEAFGEPFDEMMFSKWMTFLASLVCSIYGMDPAEINFESFSANKSALSGSDTGEKLAESKDKGLRPFMAFYEGLFTDFLIESFSDKYVFRFTGLDEEDPQLAWEAEKLILTVNEIRSERGYEPYPHDDTGLDLGTAPVNPALMAAWQQAMMPEQPAAGEGEFGGEKPEEGEDFGDAGGDAGDDDSGMPPDRAPDPEAADGGDFGSSSKPTEMAKAVVYRFGSED